MKILSSQVILFAVLTTANLIPRVIGFESLSVSEEKLAGTTEAVISGTQTTEESTQIVTSTLPPSVNTSNTANNESFKKRLLSNSPQLVEVLEPIRVPIEDVQVMIPESVGNPGSFSNVNMDSQIYEDPNDGVYSYDGEGPQQILTLVPLTQQPELSQVEAGSMVEDTETEPERVQVIPVQVVEDFVFPDPQIAISTNVNENENENVSSDEDGNLGDEVVGSAIQIDRDDENENTIVAAVATESKGPRAFPKHAFNVYSDNANKGKRVVGKPNPKAATTGLRRQVPVSVYIAAKPQSPNYGYYAYNSRPQRPQWGSNNYNYYSNAGNPYGYGNGNGNGYARPAPFNNNNYYGSGWNSYNSLSYGNGYNRFNKRPTNNYYGTRYQYQPAQAAIGLSLGRK